jgi:uncharacterized protein (TIGR02246 family)
MRHAFLLLIALALLGCQTVSTISVDQKAEVAAATKAWETTANICDASAIAALYADGAVLWGTTRTSMITTSQGIYDYFASSCKVLPGVKVQFGDQAVRVYGDMAVNSGTYIWSFTRDGVPRSLPARYSFTYVKQAGRWLIVDHHSSAFPAAPATQTAPPPKQ